MLRRGVLVPGELADKRLYPRVRELAAGAIPVAVACGNEARQAALLPLARRAITDAEWVEVHRANALFDAHRDDAEFGYQFLVERPARQNR